MLQSSSLWRFFGAAPGDKLIALEAVVELVKARMSTLGSAKHFTSYMGALDGTPIAANAEQQRRAARIGYVVAQTARLMPFRCVCLQQVLAVREMLKRRHIPATVYLGVLPDEMVSTGVADRHKQQSSTGAVAHAWIKSGDRVINGETPDLGNYVVLGIFS